MPDKKSKSLKKEEIDRLVAEDTQFLQEQNQPGQREALTRTRFLQMTGRQEEVAPEQARAWDRLFYMGDSVPEEWRKPTKQAQDNLGAAFALYQDIENAATALMEKAKADVLEQKAKAKADALEQRAKVRQEAENTPRSSLEQIEGRINPGIEGEHLSSLGDAQDVGRHAVKGGMMSAPLTEAQKRQIITAPREVIEAIKLEQHRKEITPPGPC